jgi:hypothetical protein
VSSKRTKDPLETIMIDSDLVVTTITEWVSSVLDIQLSEHSKRVKQMREELRVRDARVEQAEERVRRLTEEEVERMREKERWMETEMEGLKERVRTKEEERQEGISREERMHRQC